jgi:hypothetical protein
MARGVVPYQEFAKAGNRNAAKKRIWAFGVGFRMARTHSGTMIVAIPAIGLLRIVRKIAAAGFSRRQIHGGPIRYTGSWSAKSERIKARSTSLVSFAPQAQR